MKTLAAVTLAVVACSSWGQSVISVRDLSHSRGYELSVSSTRRVTIETTSEGGREVRVVFSDEAEDLGPRVGERCGSPSRRARADASPSRGSPGTRWALVDVDPVAAPEAPEAPDDDWTLDAAAPAPAPRAMRGTDFARLEDAIESESLAQQKWAVLQAALRDGARFTVAQVGHLVSFFEAPEQRLSLVEVARRRIVDPKNQYRLYSYFDSDAEKQQLRSLLGRRVE